MTLQLPRKSRTRFGVINQEPERETPIKMQPHTHAQQKQTTKAQTKENHDIDNNEAYVAVVVDAAVGSDRGAVVHSNGPGAWVFDVTEVSGPTER